MDFKTLIILVLSAALSGVLGYLYSQKRKMKKGGKKKGGMKKGGKKKGGMKKGGMKKKDSVIKPEGAAKGEPAESQRGVAQYVIENGL